MDLTRHFDTRDGQVLYVPNFAKNREQVMTRLVEIGKNFSRNGHRIRGGLCETGKEFLISEKNVKGGVPGVKWDGTPVETISKDITKFLHKNKMIPRDSRVNYCLYNLYETGSDVISAHSDSELNSLPIIISVTFGYPRKFVFTHKTTKDQIELNPASGSMLIFRGDINTTYTHCIPSEAVPRDGSGMRVNLTFRVVSNEIKNVPRVRKYLPDISFDNVVIGGHKRSMFCEDFHFVTPEEALGRSDCIMYKNWGLVGNTCVDREKIRSKIEKMSNTTKVFGSSDWFIVPGKSSKKELESRFTTLKPYMEWKFPHIRSQRPQQVNVKVFADIYNKMPTKGQDRRVKVLLEKVF